MSLETDLQTRSHFSTSSKIYIKISHDNEDAFSSIDTETFQEGTFIKQPQIDIEAHSCLLLPNVQSERTEVKAKIHFKGTVTYTSSIVLLCMDLVIAYTPLQ